jgi:hypothetical protein
MKKVAAALTAAVIVLSVVGCGEGSETDPISLLVDVVRRRLSRNAGSATEHGYRG